VITRVWLTKKLCPMVSLTIGLAGLLSSCVTYVGISHQQHLKNPAQFQTTMSLKGQEGRWPSYDWATQFGDRQLVSLISEALAKNPDLDAAKARIRQADAVIYERQSVLFPRIDFQGYFARNKTLTNGVMLPSASNSWQSIDLSVLNVNYELDFWGKNYAHLAQALSNKKVSQASAQTASLILATNIASTYNELAYNYAFQEISKATVTLWKTLYLITKVRIDSGLDTQIELYQVRNLQATAQTQLTAIEGQLTIIKQRLGILLGGGPDRGLSIHPPKLRYFHQPPLPNNLPLALLGRRPDIVAARWQVEAALFGVRNSKAMFYPNINLRATAGYLSFGLSHFFSNTNQLSSLTPAVSLPIFDAGVLRAQLRGRYATLDEAIAIYNSTLNQALGDVAQQLASIRSIDDQLRVEQQALDSARQAFVLSKKQYRIGLTTQLVVLNIKIRYLIEQQNRLNLIKTRRNLQVALIKALGGGFRERLLTKTNVSLNGHLEKDAYV
jgi:NodT family efflux transporter outer membrane factor (OMF) lipoprotein